MVGFKITCDSIMPERVLRSWIQNIKKAEANQEVVLGYSISPALLSYTLMIYLGDVNFSKPRNNNGP